MAHRPRQAAEILDRYLKRKHALYKNQAAYLLAFAYMNNKQYELAEKVFAKLEKEYPLLADYHRYYRARCLYQMKDYAKAETTAALVDSSSVLEMDAALTRADALNALSRHVEESKIWIKYLARRPKGKMAGKAHYQIAQSLERQAATAGDRAATLLAEALMHYKKTTIKAPLWRGEPKAARRLAALSAVVAGKEKAALEPWEQYLRAKVYFRNKRHKQAEWAFSKIVAIKGIDRTLSCKAYYHWARSIYRQRQRARAVPIFEKAEQACRKAGENDLVVKSLFHGAKGLFRRRDFKRTIDKFLQLEKEFKHHSYADDARLWAAEAYEYWGRDRANKTTSRKDTKRAPKNDHRWKKQIVHLLSTLPNRHPSGDMAREALWRLARMAILDQQYKLALRYLDRILEEIGMARIYYAQGQALYWKARILEQMRKYRRAATFYERCIREYPLSYYSLMAFNRLRERRSRLYWILRRELIDKAGRRPGRWRFKANKVFMKPGFLRGVELVRLGFGSAASREFASIGLNISRRADPDDLWLLAVLFDRGGLWHQSHRVPRTLDRGYRNNYPLGENYRYWAISYPRAFASVVRDNARRAGISPYLVLSIMREESGFSPTIESWANAVGLMQLLLRTAQKAGNAHAIQVTRNRLQDPAINIKVGTTYLGFLYHSFSKAAPLAIAGYNAGEGAVLKWLGKRGKIPMDEFIDRIPYDQTRRYTKRVLSTLFTYSVLYGNAKNKIPRISQMIPKAKLVSFGKRSRKRLKKKRVKRRLGKKRRRPLKRARGGAR